MDVTDNQILCGIGYGFIAAGILGFILVQLRASRIRMGQANRPLDAFPDASQPGLTPAGIVWSSRFGMFTCILWAIIFIATTALVIYLLPTIIDLVKDINQ